MMHEIERRPTIHMIEIINTNESQNDVNKQVFYWKSLPNVEITTHTKKCKAVAKKG